jgi:hypothetical protein
MNIIIHTVLPNDKEKELNIFTERVYNCFDDKNMTYMKELNDYIREFFSDSAKKEKVYAYFDDKNMAYIKKAIDRAIIEEFRFNLKDCITSEQYEEVKDTVFNDFQIYLYNQIKDKALEINGIYKTKDDECYGYISVDFYKIIKEKVSDFHKDLAQTYFQMYKETKAKEQECEIEYDT